MPGTTTTVIEFLLCARLWADSYIGTISWNPQFTEGATRLREAKLFVQGQTVSVRQSRDCTPGHLGNLGSDQQCGLALPFLVLAPQDSTGIHGARRAGVGNAATCGRSLSQALCSGRQNPPTSSLANRAPREVPPPSSRWGDGDSERKGDFPKVSWPAVGEAKI